jgi:hypothetical protein
VRIIRVVVTLGDSQKALITCIYHNPFISKNTLLSNKINPPEADKPSRGGQAYFDIINLIG